MREHAVAAFDRGFDAREAGEGAGGLLDELARGEGIHLDGIQDIAQVVDAIAQRVRRGVVFMGEFGHGVPSRRGARTVAKDVFNRREAEALSGHVHSCGALIGA